MENKGAGLALAGLVALSLFVVAAIPAYAQPVITVSIGDVTLSHGESTTIPIMITKDTPQGVSSARINLTYDSSVVEVISAGNSDFDEFTPNIVDGKVIMIGFQVTPALTTPIKFADVTIKAIGSPYTPLNLEIVELNMATGPSPIYPREVSNGSVKVPVPVPEYNVSGLSVLIGLLGIILAISIRAKRE